MKLLSMILENYKGIKYLIIDFKEFTSISGMNKSGKTTIRNAFLWCFTGKDEQGRADHEIKTIGVKKGIHSVTIMTDSGVFSRTFKEKYAKNRKTGAEEFKGHETIFSIDCKEVKKKDYQVAVDELFQDVEIFKVINNPNEIENLHWKKLRGLLVGLCGDIKLEEYDIDTFKKKQSKLDSELDKISIKIETLNEMAPVSLPDDYNEQVKKAEFDLKVLNEVLATEKGSDPAVKIREEKRKLELEQTSKCDPLVDQGIKIDRQIKSFLTDISFTEQNIVSAKQEKTRLEKRLNELRKENIEVKKQTQEKCFSCGQDLPSEMLEKMNNEKAEKLKKLIAEGTATKSKVEIADIHIKRFQDGIVNVQSEIATHEKKKEEVANKRIATSKEYDDKINALVITPVDYSEFETKIEVAQTVLDNLKTSFACFDASIATRDKIRELEEERRVKGQEFEKLSGEIDKVLEKQKAFLKGISSEINKNFDSVRFQLFEEQVNGEIKEVCTPFLDDIPFSTANNAGRINAGIEIAEKISKLTGIKAPVFVDNAEAVNTLYRPEELQLVAFYVTKKPLVIK